MFEKNYELRYSDLDVNEEVKTSGVIDLLQDISINHANSVGLDREKFMSLSIACLLSGWRIRFLKPLDSYETTTVKTGIMKLTKFETYRKYEIWQNGECKVIATGLWFTVNTENMRISRDTDKIFSVFENVNEEDNNMPCDKLRGEENTVLAGKTVVEKRDLDSNNHMNNVKSVEAVLGFLPCDIKVDEIQVKYRKELKCGEELSIYKKENNDALHYEIQNENGDLCVIVSVLKK